MTRKPDYESFIRGQSDRNDTRLQEAIRLHQSGQFQEAESIYASILSEAPEYVPVLHLSGLLAHQTGDQKKAISYIKKAIALEPDNAMYHTNLGAAYEQQHQLKEAIGEYQEAISLDPQCYEAYNNMGNLCKTAGHLEEAATYFNKALDIHPTFTEALLNLVEGPRVSNADEEKLFHVAQTLLQQPLSEDERIRVYFTLGKLCDRRGAFKEGFEYFRLGNAQKRKQVDFNAEAHGAFVTRTTQLFSKDFIKEKRTWGSGSQLPVFIFGMPRSGTTLVEQILASHPNVFGGGELQFFVQVRDKLSVILEVEEGYPECLRWVHEQTAKNLEEVYLKKTGELSHGKDRVAHITDKNPFNFLHLGLIALLFPQATFIHCKRNPLDTCLSIFFHHFTTGNAFAYDLAELGEYYGTYGRLMDHWGTVLPATIMEVEYEELVRSQEAVSRRLIEHCGLKWDPVCLAFHEHDRPVYTASNWQVRQPLYESSSGRWQNYKAMLDPLKDLLAEWL